MSYRASAYVQCLADLVKLFNWRQVIVLYEDDGYGSTSSGIVPMLNDALQSVGSQITYHAAFPSLDSMPNPEDVIHQELKTLNSRLCKVFIVVQWSSSSLVSELFKVATTLGMMAKGHVWIAGDDITTLLDSTLSPSDISSYMQGVIGVKTYINESRKPYNDFSEKFQQKFQSEYSKSGETKVKPGMHALLAYDAVHVIAKAYAISGKSLLEGIQSSDFVGLSGRVRFRRDGSLIEGKGTLAFRVINVVGKSSRDMGFWLKGRGFYRDGAEQAASINLFGTIYWPGGAAEKIPGGWGKLRVGVPTRSLTELLVNVEFDGKGEVKEVNGFCVEVYKEARELLNYELPYEFFPFNGTYDELVASVPEKFDAVIGDVTILSKRMNRAMFTEPFLPTGLSMVVPVKPNNKKWVLTQPFSPEVWLLVLASYIYTCVTVWYLEHKQNPDFDVPWREQLGATLWLIFCTIFFAHGKFYSYYTKAVIAVWLFVLLILTSTFTASLGSILITQQLEPVVNDKKIGCNGASFVMNHLEDVLGYKDKQIELIPKIENYSTAFKSGAITMAYLETPYLKIFLSQYGSEHYTVHGDTQRLGGFGFAFAKNSPLIADFSKAILQLSESGTLGHLEEKWFSQSLVTCPNTCNTKTMDNLTLDSLWVLFLLTGAASTIVLLLFKSGFIASSSRRSLAVASWPLRRKCLQLRITCKYKSRRGLPVSRSSSIYSTQVAPESAAADSLT
ncbi:uncharacterized protein A4U43_C01F25310 [Asparagus officinalis]|uniref:Ionotropic glutamate receptor C-terminal domain-containing protein n=2 Tax=Asparagus officinalis TaxID=4686 RepID=A0A5P1FW59_ASPOF|nr:uncharacterized protein A4U43_C01F25310 [Asparagus officinalis]